MSKLPQVKARNLIKVVTGLGFEFRDQSGSHAVYIHPDGRRTTISIHPSQTIGIGLLTKIIKKICRLQKVNLSNFLSDFTRYLQLSTF